MADRTFRLTWLCPTCKANHIERGSGPAVHMVAMCLMIEGSPSVLIEDEAYAMECDIVESEEACP